MQETLIKLIDRKLLNQNTLAMWFDRGNYKFEAGQYARITLLEPKYFDEEGNSRLFSIASSPTKDYLMFTTRNLDSAFNKNIKELPLGTKATIGEPGGKTVLHKDTSKPAVFLIGGIGITPVRCIIEYITENKLPYKAYLFYSNPNSSSMAFLEEFEKWAKENNNFKFIPTIDDKEDKNWKYNFGFINKELITKNLPEIQNSIYYIVGPLVMVENMENILKELEVKEENIIAEKFG